MQRGTENGHPTRKENELYSTYSCVQHDTFSVHEESRNNMSGELHCSYPSSDRF